MWTQPGGLWGPPMVSSSSTVLAVRVPTNPTGPLYFGPNRAVPEASIVYRLSTSPPQTGLQMLMPLDLQTHGRMRYGNRRFRPYRLRHNSLSAIQTFEYNNEEDNIQPENQQSNAENSPVPQEAIQRTDCAANQCSHSLLPSFQIESRTEEATVTHQYTPPNEVLTSNSSSSTSEIHQNLSPVSLAQRSISNNAIAEADISNTDNNETTENISSSILMNSTYSPENSLRDILRANGVKEVNINFDHAHCKTLPLPNALLCCPGGSSDPNATVPPLHPPARLLAVPGAMPPSPVARQVAKKVIKHARDLRVPFEVNMKCLNCGLLPILPVTGLCGHTRCYKCTELNRCCPCGVPAPESLHVNILIRDLIGKLLPNQQSKKQVKEGENQNETSPSTSLSANNCVYSDGIRCTTNRQPMSPMTYKARYKLARDLLSVGRYKDATPHLALVAASSELYSKSARLLLVQAIQFLSQGSDPRRITRDLYRLVRQQAGSFWLQPSDLECILCSDTFSRPVTTPCGHTYCRTCVERSMDYRNTCALCLRPLDDFNLASTGETTFVNAALASINALSSPPPPEPDVIPIFACTVAYPGIPCPLFIIDPRYWLMIRRVLESGSRKFGMIAYIRDRAYADYGTMLEVRDCVQLEDGRSILSTVGVSRFKVIERGVRDGCDVARIQPLADILPDGDDDLLALLAMRVLAEQIANKAGQWLSTLNEAVIADIETAFGQMYVDYQIENWFRSPNGPDWLWWLIAILPLRSEIQVLILSTKHLVKRMLAVLRTLDAMDHVSTAGPMECEFQTSFPADWLARHS